MSYVPAGQLMVASALAGVSPRTPNHAATTASSANRRIVITTSHGCKTHFLLQIPSESQKKSPSPEAPLGRIFETGLRFLGVTSGYDGPPGGTISGSP